MRSKWLFAYTLFFIATSYGLTSISNDSSTIAISLLNVLLLVIPLVSIIFGTIYFYNNKEYILFMLSQPIPRGKLYLGLMLGLIFPLIISFVFGIFLPILIFANDIINNYQIWISIFAAGIFETIIFTSIAIAIANVTVNRIMGLGISIFIWLFVSAIYDGLLMLLMNSFSDYPIERFSLIMVLLNPVDLARIFVILKLDVSALMGYTGAIFNNFFGTLWGTLISFGVLICWGIIPTIFGYRKFLNKDL